MTFFCPLSVTKMKNIDTWLLRCGADPEPEVWRPETSPNLGTSWDAGTEEWSRRSTRGLRDPRGDTSPMNRRGNQTDRLNKSAQQLLSSLPLYPTTPNRGTNLRGDAILIEQLGSVSCNARNIKYRSRLRRFDLIRGTSCFVYVCIIKSN